MRANPVALRQSLRLPLRLIVPRLNGADIGDPSYRQYITSLAKAGIGGFIVFGGEMEHLRAFMSDLNKTSASSLIIASDVERGVGQQIEGYTRFPCQMAVASALNIETSGDRDILSRMIGALAEEALFAGINMPLIPVMDVNTEPENPIICTRAFSGDPAAVSRFGCKYVKGLEAKGLISCPKHFPGHGGTSVDSHISLPVIADGKDTLASTHIAPFAEAIKCGASAVMIGHLVAQALDGLPASLSYKTITGLLRNSMGFNGLVVTDALNMDALKDFDDAPLMCLKAGADILLHPSEPEAVAAMLVSALESGSLPEDIVESSLKRIDRALMKTLPPPGEVPDFDAHMKLAELITGKSISLAREAPRILPIKGGARLVAAGEATVSSLAPLREALPVGDGTVVVAIRTAPAAWKGNSGIGNDEIGRIRKEIEGRKAIVISFGSPYVLGHFPEAGALVAAYEMTPSSQRAVAFRLLGEAPFEGRLPVRISP